MAEFGLFPKLRPVNDVKINAIRLPSAICHLSAI
jgi:hypothetical protein